MYHLIFFNYSSLIFLYYVNKKIYWLKVLLINYNLGSLVIFIRNMFTDKLIQKNSGIFFDFPWAQKIFPVSLNQIV